MSFKTLPIYEVNPFIPGLVSKFEVRHGKGVKKEELLRLNQGEITGEVVTADVSTGADKFYFLDRRPFIKVFNDLDNFKQMANLSKSANYLFWLIASTIKPNMHTVRLSLSEYLDFSETTNTGQFYNAICELADKFIIAKQGNDVYFINPHRFFNGDCTGIVNEYPKDIYLLRNK
jgi:hypothetical protein